MGVSFKVSKNGVRFRPKPKPKPTLVQDAPPEIHNNQFVSSTPKPSVNVAENGKDDSEISDGDISFFINLFSDGYSIGNPSEALEHGLLPADFLDDIPCKYINGAVACEEAEARVLIALYPKLDIDPTPNLDDFVDHLRARIKKRLRQMAELDNSVNGKKVCIDRVSENLGSGLMVQPSDLVNLTTQNIVPASPSLSYQSKYQIGAGNSRVMQDHGSGLVQDMMNSYPDGMNLNLGKRENQDGQLSPMTGLTKRARSNLMGLDGSQQQMDGLNSLMQQQQHQQSSGRGMQVPYNAGIQKYPFEGSFNQEPFTMGQPGVRYNLKQEPVDSELNRNMHMVDSDVDPRLQKQQRLTQQFARSSFPPTPWNTLDNSRKEEQLQRRKSAQSPRVSSGALPQSPLSSKAGEFSSGSGSLTSNAQMAARRTNSLPQKPCNDRKMVTARYQLNMKKNKVDEYRRNLAFSTKELSHHLFNDLNIENTKDEACRTPLSKSLVGGSMNVCKTRVLNFVQTERVLQGNGFSLVPKSRTRMILSEKRNDGTVAMHYGELDDSCCRLACSSVLQIDLLSREGYLVEGDHLQPKRTNTVLSSGGQQSYNTSGDLSPNIEIPETVSGQPSNETAKPSDSGTNSNNGSVISSGARMHSNINSQSLQISQGGGHIRRNQSRNRHSNKVNIT
ncbi:hypothetical protein L1987_31472 [Smallanthus sonchifolius]|uniref:Uncharacterized protein n=1 Tax=Smallanthus sonchifolius TaxID=185202 RepID=A0ACB9I8D6_9ASTR|nr:hypothetical protein L1987_31472 [Smallanthus sonchifolius]